ncbi:hypothetical protein [Pseudomonas helleri]|uniref:hypothetical protein n=1 Tax=Pseudomonas helleri TaxID=1608996 RepID=UPI003D0FED9E
MKSPYLGVGRALFAQREITRRVSRYSWQHVRYWGSDGHGSQPPPSRVQLAHPWARQPTQ